MSILTVFVYLCYVTIAAKMLNKEINNEEILFSSRSLVFSDEVRKRAARRARYRCEECGTKCLPPQNGVNKIRDKNRAKSKCHHLIERTTAISYLPHTEKVRQLVRSDANCLFVCAKCEHKRVHGDLELQRALAANFLGIRRNEFTGITYAEPPEIKKKVRKGSEFLTRKDRLTFEAKANQELRDQDISEESGEE